MGSLEQMVAQDGQGLPSRHSSQLTRLHQELCYIGGRFPHAQCRDFMSLSEVDQVDHGPIFENRAAKGNPEGARQATVNPIQSRSHAQPVVRQGFYTMLVNGVCTQPKDKRYKTTKKVNQSVLTSSEVMPK